MLGNQWPAETVDRAEQALAELEAFWDEFERSTSYGRQLKLPQLLRIRQGIVSVTDSDSHALKILTRLDGVCHRLARERPPLDFDEERTLVQGLGDVSNMRGWMAEMGLVKESVRKSTPQ